MTQLIRASLVCAAGALALGCNDQPTEPGPTELVIVQAPSTVGAPGWELIDTLVVRAVDPSGQPRAGVKVTWAVRQGGGSIAPTADVTDADGYAKAVWTLGGRSGVNQVRARTVEGSQADFESTGEAFRADVVASDIVPRLRAGKPAPCGAGGSTSGQRGARLLPSARDGPWQSCQPRTGR